MRAGRPAWHRAVVAGVAGFLAVACASPGAAMRFAVKGDWGDGSKNQIAVTKWMCAEYAKTPFAFTLTTGDNFYDSGTARRDSFQIAE